MAIEDARKALDRLADALAEDVFDTPDEDILAEFREQNGDPDELAAHMRVLFEKSFAVSNKRRRRSAVSQQRSPVVIADARAFLRRLLEMPGAVEMLTLAARNENELSDADILGILDALRELGLDLADDQSEKS